MKIIYEPHPVTTERKKQLRAQGYTIIDAVFAPDGYEYPEANKDAGEGGQGDKSLTVPQIKEALAAKGVEIPEGAKKAELQALLDAAGKGGQGE